MSNTYPVVSWNGMPGVTYDIEKSTNLLETAGFKKVHEVTPLEEGVQKFADTSGVEQATYKVTARYDQ